MLKIESFSTIDIDVDTPEGPRTLKLLDVAFVPHFKARFASLRRFTDKGVH